jgi:NH3-dependent NAD+ synthetase
VGLQREERRYDRGFKGTRRGDRRGVIGSRCKKVVVGLSGGVDSSVACLLFLESCEDISTASL